MRNWAACLLALGVAACAGVAPAPAERVPVELFDAQPFAAPLPPVDTGAALAASPSMRAYLAARLANKHRASDRRQLLVDALYRGDLKLEYDAATTRTAAEAFDARAGNCLALVLMTAAFAKELDLVVHYQQVLGEPVWNRADSLLISIGHVNLVLEERREPSGFFLTTAGPMTIDFLPPADARLLHVRPIGEATVVAMYLNNRAVEELAAGRLDAAYAHARAAIEQDASLAASIVTLGVIDLAIHRPDLADRAFAHVLARDPEELSALANRIAALRQMGRVAESEALARRLAALQPDPPFAWFREGVAAYRAGRYEEARRLFERELERAPYHHEFEYWLAATYAQQNDLDRAVVHLRRAMAVSTTRRDHDLYAGKLDRLKALQVN